MGLRVRLLWVAGVMVLAACTPGDLRFRPPAGPERESVIRISGSGTALPLVERLAEVYGRGHPEVRFQFRPGTNSGGGIQGVLQGTLDLAVTNRPLSPREVSRPLVYHPFAQDAVVFALRLPNPVQGLTTGQIRQIFAGRLTNWQQLGGHAAPIVVLDRDPDESMRQLVLLPLLDGGPVAIEPIVLTRASDMVEALASTPDALGYTSYGLLNLLQPQDVRVLALDGVKPGPESVVAGTYPWYLTFGLVHPAGASPAVTDFLDFVLGAEGRRLMEEYGYVAAPFD